MKKTIFLAALFVPALAMADTTPPVHHFTHNNTSAKATELHVDKQSVSRDKQALSNAENNLQNDRLNGNRSEVQADRAQIASLNRELHTDKVILHNDGSYSYARRPHDLNGWGDDFHDSNSNSNSTHSHNGWGN